VTSLPSLRAGLFRHKLDNELLVYDPVGERIHLLNGTTTAVVEMMDEGVTAEAIIERLDRMHAAPVGSHLLALALDELAKAGLTEVAENTTGISDVSRRQMLQRVAAVGAMLLTPAIASLTPAVLHAQSACGTFCASLSSNCTNPACACCAKPSAGPDHTCINAPLTNANCHGL
jgi:hypothetical protein